MNISQAVEAACKQPSLVLALNWIAIWETERVVAQAKEYFRTGVSTASHGGGWDTCFEICFEQVLSYWADKERVRLHYGFGPDAKTKIIHTRETK